MRIAVACDGLEIAPSFVQCSSYMCYSAEGNAPVDSRNIPASDQPPSQLPDFFRAIEAEVLICGRIDPELLALFESNGLTVIPGKSGDPLTCVREYLAQRVETAASPA